MNAEIVGVGTELLLGQIANTNAQRISQALATIGVDVFRHVVVGDNLARVAETIKTAADRSDVVIITGGLGPTPDDLTREGVAEAFGIGLRRDPDLERQVTEIFSKIRRNMPSENLKQADLPEGATAIPPEGTAPGFQLEVDGCILFAVPGVPWEMEAMLTKTILPLLAARSGAGVIASREILVVGVGESHTHQKIADIVEAQSNPTVAYLAGAGLVRVRISAKASTESEALALITPVEDEVRGRLGIDALPGAYGTVAATLAEMLRDKGATVGAAESLTGGLIGSELTSAGGASDFFAGSLVCYTNEAKRDVAGVPEAILQGPGAVSEEAAAALAQGAAHRLGADLGVSATGVAGPAEQDGKPVGTIYVGATFGGRTEVRHVKGYGDRDNIRRCAVNAALDLGRRLVQAE
ncbi:MAG: nicotinamide-nucleotide amidase [Actinomycetota bacterium]|jgi:nicotinamide-nucleotide amidase|nr:nicotinamide-nucleotide amidase [Actinomycetota bacterium]